MSAQSSPTSCRWPPFLLLLNAEASLSSFSRYVGPTGLLALFCNTLQLLSPRPTATSCSFSPPIIWLHPAAFIPQLSSYILQLLSLFPMLHHAASFLSFSRVTLQLLSLFPSFTMFSFPVLHIVAHLPSFFCFTLKLLSLFFTCYAQ